MHGNAWQDITGSTDVFADDRVVYSQQAIVIIAYEKNRRTIGIHLVVFEQGSANRLGHGIAVGIDGSAAATSWCSRLRRVSAIADRPVVGEYAIDHGNKSRQDFLQRDHPSD